MDFETQLKLRFEVGHAFSPGAPINEKSLFAGRSHQRGQIIDAITQRGQHAVLFGERGVGKTSLANMLGEWLEGVGKSIFAPRINCDTVDTFSSVWRKVFERIVSSQDYRPIGFTGAAIQTCASLATRYEGDIRPDDVLRSLQSLGEQSVLIVTIDEFDRLREKSEPERKSIQALMADTIKMLSDHSIPVTIVLVGIADSVNELIEGHQSTERALVQVRMPRMSKPELQEVINHALQRVEMTIDELAMNLITELSRGLPHYAHLLGLHSAREAIEGGVLQIASNHVGRGVRKAIADAQQSIQTAYHKATTSPRRESRYPQVLLACAQANRDEMGYFAPADVREPLRTITGRDYGIPAFMRHLNEFSEERRGPVLQKHGKKHRTRFRFVNPLMEPHILMRGIEKSWEPDGSDENSPT